MSRLSQELDTVMAPADVYPFPFLHEIGHTERAGNKNFCAAVVNLALAGRMRSLKNRLELFELRRKTERFVDDFALSELPRWREREYRNSGSPHKISVAQHEC